MEVFLRIDAVAPAALQDRIDDCTALSGFRMPDEEPVLFSNGCWADGIFNQIVVDLYLAVFAVGQELLPVGSKYCAEGRGP